jgi:hypothetical protein
MKSTFFLAIAAASMFAATGCTTVQKVPSPTLNTLRSPKPIEKAGYTELNGGKTVSGTATAPVMKVIVFPFGSPDLAAQAKSVDGATKEALAQCPEADALLVTQQDVSSKVTYAPAFYYKTEFETTVTGIPVKFNK